MTGYIYKFSNPENGKCYIGKTSNLKERLYKHKTITPTKHTKFGSAVKKHGLDFFDFTILITIRRINDKRTINNILNNLEKYFIKKFDSFNCGYNSTIGGDGTENYKVSEETKLSISKSHKKNMTPERYARLCSALKSYGRMGIITKETIDKAHLAVRKKVQQCYPNGEIVNTYSSIAEAARSLGKTRSAENNIILACKNKIPYYLGFVWQYV